MGSLCETWTDHFESFTVAIMPYYQILNISNSPDATSGTGTAYLSGVRVTPLILSWFLFLNR
jgi:hypothetical protein